MSEPKDGDRVRYTIEGTYRDGEVVIVGGGGIDGVGAWSNCIYPEGTVEVLPPALPPEPPIGTIGYVDGNPVQRAGNLWWLYGDGVISLEWAEIADRFVHAIPNDGSYVKRADVEAWLMLYATIGPTMRNEFRAKFGGASDPHGATAYERRVAAQALRDAAADVEAHRPWDGTLTRTIVKEWLRERANQIEASDEGTPL